MNEKRSFYIIDGSSYLYRAFYAMGRLSNSRGLPTQAVFGFAQMVRKVMKDKEPTYVCMVFDAPGPTFRHGIYEAYKATRQKMPEDLAVQIPYIKKLVQYYGIPQVEREGYEADDIIAALTRWARDLDLQVVVVSGDKDLHQLVRDPDVLQWDAQKDRVFTEAEVLDKLGVTPAQIADYLSLVGDASDNVPGVKGVGEKTAGQLLRQWGAMDAVYEHIEAVSPPGLQKKLREGKELAYLSRELVTFAPDTPFEADLDRYSPRPLAYRELVDLYQELEFKNLLDSLPREAVDGVPAPAAESARKSRTDRIVWTPAELGELCHRLKGCAVFSVDLETTSKDPMLADMVGIALSFEDHRAFYIPVGHTGEGAERQISREAALEALRPVLEAETPRKVGQNIKYDFIVFRRHGIFMRGLGFDTMVGSYLLNAGSQSHGLDRISLEYLGEPMISYEDVTGKGKSQIGFARVAIPVAAEYACEDAETTWRLMPVIRERLQHEGLMGLFESLEMPLIEVLAAMEMKGILVDAKKLEALSVEFQGLLDGEARRIFDMAKEEFNIQSPKQLSYILFEKLGLPVIKRTKTGPSTDVSVLESLALEHPIGDCLLHYRSLAKLKGTYTDALTRLIHPETGRIHTSFNQTVAATGRLSSSDPNLQNIPIRSEEGRKIRAAFVPAPGCVLLSADYSQIELRILAHYSRDEHLLEAFSVGDDIHRRTAAEMFGIPPHEVTSEMRRQAKTINFGIIYGMGPFGLAQRLRISQKTAKAAIDRYLERYRGVKAFMEESPRKARERGYSETLLGRKRAIPELDSRNRTIRQQGERLAINTPIQGTAADLIKKAMVDLEGALREKRMKAAMLLQVHDELVLEVPREELHDAGEIVREKMEGVWELAVPLRVDMGMGENWAEAHP